LTITRRRSFGWYQVGVFVLAFLLMLALPARRGHSGGPASV
jgi:hypothetical protein